VQLLFDLADVFGIHGCPEPLVVARIIPHSRSDVVLGFPSE